MSLLLLLKSWLRKPQPPSPLPVGGVFFGGWVGQAPGSFSLQAAFDQRSGKNASVYLWGTGWSAAFAAGGASAVRAAGYVPFWHIQGTSDSTLAGAAQGTLDWAFDERGAEVAAWRHPIFFRAMHEMNGNWYTWGNQDPATYIAAWRRMVDRMRAAGARNAAFVWCPNVEPAATGRDVRSYYPGDEYVDWVGLDGYRAPGETRTFEEVFAATYDKVCLVSSRPVMICETGAVEQALGGSKASWISGMFASLPARFPRVRGVVWFDAVGEGRDWRLTTSQAATDAWRVGVSSQRFQTSTFSALVLPPPVGAP